ncbi:MAG: 8-amino-7-oxononanoate synthase [Acidobacteriia bacterium]|nr:8-amino-7-oxononanoate synthase [Terriglobia bacterium]
MPTKTHARLRQELERELRALEARRQRRTLAAPAGVNLCSNDYLGLAENAELHAAVVRAVEDTLRVGGTGSRLLSGHSAVWEELEEEFARFAGTEAALYFGSGYAANLGLLGALLGKDDLAFSDALNHASLIDGLRLSGARKVVYPHLDLGALESALREHAAAPGRKVIVTESVFGMDGDCAPIAQLLELGERHGAGLIVDEAHATAVHGPAGRGLAAAAGAEQHAWAVLHMCGKALASAGAFVCGSELLKQMLVNRARPLIFSTAMPPYLTGQIRAALRLARAMDAERAALLERSRSFAADLRSAGWNTAGSASQIVPVLIGGNGEAIAAAEHLQAAGFAVRPIRPPTVPEGTSRLRLSLTSAITAETLQRLGAALKDWREQRPQGAAVIHA